MVTARYVVVGGIAVLMGCRVAHAQEVAAGWEGDDRRGYAFASPTVSTDFGEAQAFVVRAAVSYLYYDFPVSDGRVVVTSPGIGGAVGYRVHGRHVNATFTTGYEVRNTLRAQPDATLKTLERGPFAGGELFVSAGPLTRISAIANYGQANQYTWARSSVTRQLTNRRFEKPRTIGAGIDVTMAGNRDVRTQQVGGVLVWDWFRAKGSLQLRGGFSRSLASGTVIDRHPYVAVGLYRHFDHRRAVGGSS